MEYDIDDVVKVRGAAYGIVTDKTLNDDGTLEYGVKALEGATTWLLTEDAMRPTDRGFPASAIQAAKKAYSDNAPIPFKIDIGKCLEDLCRSGLADTQGHRVAFRPPAPDCSYDPALRLYWIRLRKQ